MQTLALLAPYGHLLFVVVTLVLVIVVMLLRGLSIERDLQYGTWYWHRGQEGQPILIRETRSAVMVFTGLAIQIALAVEGIVGREAVKPIVFVGAAFICVVQLVVTIELARDYVRADADRLRARHRRHQPVRDHATPHH